MAEIKSIRIKGTTKDLIREIRLGLTGATAVHINGLEGFEQFKDDLIDAAADDVGVAPASDAKRLQHILVI
jgi:hypothetical protein